MNLIPYYESGTGIILYHGDVMEVMSALPDGSVDCIVTSPPYYNKRNYRFKGQWGLEKTFEEYLEKMWRLMGETYRVLKPEGTCFVNLADTYAKNGTAGGTKYVQANGGAQVPHMFKQSVPVKSLCFIPQRFAIGCVDRGWIARNEIDWFKPDGMPESVDDRFSTKTENIYFFVKQRKYYFDKKAASVPTLGGHTGELFGGTRHRREFQITGVYEDKGFKNPGDFWEMECDAWKIPTAKTTSGHFAVMPDAIPERCVKAGCPKGGVVLDPFCGNGTVLKVALYQGRKGIGINASKEFLDGAIYHGSMDTVDNFGKEKSQGPVDLDGAAGSLFKEVA